MPPKRASEKAPSRAKKKTAGKKTKRPTEEYKTGFLDLPHEIRNQIYHLALMRTPGKASDATMLPPSPELRTILTRTTQHPHLWPQRADPVPQPRGAAAASASVVLHGPPILVNTRQIRSEALQVFYANNSFTNSYAIYVPKLVRQLGPERTAMVMCIQATGTEALSLPYISIDRWLHAVVHDVNNLS